MTAYRFLVLLGALMTLFSSLTQAEEKEPILIGFAQDHLANDWRLAQVKALQQGLADIPGLRFIYSDAKGHTAQQILDIEDMLRMGVDILVTSPRDGVAMTPIIERAHQQGVPVILLTRRITSPAYTSFISPDDQAIARAAAQFMADRLNGQGSIVILQGVPTASTAVHRTQAFVETLSAYPGIRIVATRAANYLRNDAIRAMEEILNEGLAFDAIYAQSDSMASGARMAMRQHGIDPANYLIVGIDYIAEAQAAIMSGEQTASYTYPTSAEQAVEVIHTILRGELPPREIEVPSIRVDRSNVHLVEPIF